MAEYNKVMEERNRMCDYYHSIYNECDFDCPLSQDNNPALVNYSDCSEFLYKEAEKAEQIIMKWSKEHPQPIYPTIGEVVDKLLILMNIGPRTPNLTAVCNKHLTKEAADYFGIKPIDE
jgi:hypothetical protein